MRLEIHPLTPFGGAVVLVLLAIGLAIAYWPVALGVGVLLALGFNLAKDRRRP